MRTHTTFIVMISIRPVIGCSTSHQHPSTSFLISSLCLIRGMDNSLFCLRAHQQTHIYTNKPSISLTTTMVQQKLLLK
ncbi:hypothetical protein BKA57DRAFT_470219 [Linnemannia elongata]|nr:hypothetical protein BKA57DRAFT_470219 [Linnemannia elongata]